MRDEGKDFANLIILGFIAVLIWILLDSICGTNIDQVKIFQMGEGKPAVMIVYHPGINSLLIEYNGKYIPLRDYLTTIKNKYDRMMEEATIKKVVNEEGKDKN